MLLPCDAVIKSELDNIGVDCFSTFAKDVFKASGKNTLQSDKKRAFIPNHLIADVGPKHLRHQLQRFMSVANKHFGLAMRVVTETEGYESRHGHSSGGAITTLELAGAQHFHADSCPFTQRRPEEEFTQKQLHPFHCDISIIQTNKHSCLFYFYSGKLCSYCDRYSYDY